MIELSTRLKQLRISRGLSQKDLAARLSVTASIISAYENNTRLPSYDILIKIAHIFGCSCDYLLGYENPTDTATTIDVSSLSTKQVAALLTLIDSFQTE